MNSQLVHAIIGCGRIAPAHLDAFKQLPEARLKYVCASEIEHARAFAAQHAVEHATASLNQVLQDPEVQSISIATPHDLHAPMLLAALQYGKHALIEKPFALDSSEAAKVVSAAAQSPAIRVMPVSQHRFDPVVREVAKLVLDGKLGTLLLCRAHLECFRPVEYYSESNWRGTWAREGGSVLINQAYHIIDLLVWLCGTVDQVCANMQTSIYREVMETEETLTASFTFSSGAAGGLTICGAAGSRWNSYIEIIGTKGVVAFDVGYPNLLHRLQLEDRQSLLLTKKVLKEIAGRDIPETPALSYYGISHRAQAAAFAAAILDGTSDPFAVDLFHAQKVIKTIDAFYRSAKDNRPVIVDYDR